MKYINKFFIFLMAISLSSAILTFCLDRTVLNADYVTEQADKSGVYNDLAQSLPKQLAGGGETSPQMQAALERVVTPEFLQTNFDAYFHNLETAYRSNAAVPPLDLTAIIPQVEALGVQLTPQEKTQLEQNLTIQPGSSPSAPGKAGAQAASTKPASSSSVSQVYRRAAAAKWLLILTTLILAGLVFATAPHHRLKALAHGCISATGWLAIYYAFFRLAPGIAAHQLQTAKDFSLGSSVSKLITLAAGGVAQRLLYAGVGTLSVGMVLWLASFFTPHLSTAHAHADNRTPLPTLFHKD